MPRRPAPLTLPVYYLGLVVDEIRGLRSDLGARGGAAPATPPAGKATKTSAKKPVNLDGQ